MNKTLGYSLSFVAGLVIGGFVMKKYIDKKMKEAEELIECKDDEPKEENDKDNTIERPTRRHHEKPYTKEEVNEYKDLCNKYDVVKKDFQEEVDEMSMHDAKFDPANYEDVRQPIYEDEDEFEEEIDYNEGFYDPDDDDDDDYDTLAPSENYDYDTKSKFSDADHNSEPYNIPREEFGIYDDYETTTWTCYPDEYMTDEEGLPIDPEEVRKVVGDNFYEQFVTYGEDEIWVRNDRLKIDISVIRNLENFRDCQPARIKRLAGIFD